MGINREVARQYLDRFDFAGLFTQELGWDRYTHEITKQVDGHEYRFRAVAEKRGVVILVADSIPEYANRVKVDKLIAKEHFEHLIVFGDKAANRQVWQWFRKEPGKPVAVRTYHFSTGHSGELLIQKLENLAFTLEEEEALTLTDVTGRLRTLDVEKVTKKFYDRFKAEHAAFLRFIKGIPDDQTKAWYASVMINRLMFLYFIQEKGFLNGDRDYLRNKLSESRNKKPDSYYREFLCPLFFQGFARKKAERSATINKLLGEIPYLNGGLFQPHQIEELHGKKIEIADSAFVKLLGFFKEYTWHLDERENRNDREINPDVLGYIFEKYINQKDMGAYYTKEDITEYISQNTIIPFLLDEARKGCAVAFAQDSSVWRLLREDPDRYIHDAMKVGAGWEQKPLPAEIAAGVNKVSKRAGWNRLAPEEYALPTEIWREAIDRHQRYRAVKEKLAAGEVHEVNDLVTLNLNIRQFAQDVIQFSEGPELLRAVWKAISNVSVLDPACGSGAFLFAALNVLKPLYEACLLRMDGFIEDMEAAGAHHPAQFSDFKTILEESRQHPNRDYFILKSIIVGNLFGLDVMDEALEICKLRLFLKLVAQVESQDRIEPLPDIDFNVRAGNTLIGYARYEGVKNARSKLDFSDAMSRIEDRAKTLDAAVETFRKQQTRLNGTITTEDKAALRHRFLDLETELNDYLADEYGVKRSNFSKWKESHKPFHWFCDFHRIMASGGFDVIIGNPPWKEYAAVRKLYQVRGYVTESCGNLHGIMTERACVLAKTHGRVSFIVQLPLTSSSRMNSVRAMLRSTSRYISIIPFDDRPGRLFDGLEHCRSVIFSCQKSSGDKMGTEVVSRYQRWPSEARPVLFKVLGYAPAERDSGSGTPFLKIGSEHARSIISKLRQPGSAPLGMSFSGQQTRDFIFYQEATQYWVKATVGLPFYSKNGKVGAPAHGRYLYFDDDNVAHCACAVLNSSLFYLYFVVYGDCFHLSDTLVSNFPAPQSMFDDLRLRKLGKELLRDLTKNATRKTIVTKDNDKIAYSEFFAGNSKALIDQIDTILAEHYQFSQDELDFILNYDIKFRLGADLAEDDEEP